MPTCLPNQRKMWMRIVLLTTHEFCTCVDGWRLFHKGFSHSIVIQKPMVSEKSKPGVFWSCGLLNIVFSLFAICLFTERGQSFKDISCNFLQINWIVDFHWLSFSKNLFNLVSSSHLASSMPSTMNPLATQRPFWLCANTITHRSGYLRSSFSM